MTGVPLRLPDPSLFFFTDASLKGWGASWKDHQISGIWSHTDSQRHINWLELEAIRLALLRWGPQWTNQTVRVNCDNSTAVANIRKQGGTHSQPLFQKTLELFNLLDQFMITLIPTHLPGARNVTADALSRLNQPSPTEWRLPTETLNRLFCAFGTPLIDMYATAENKVTPVFVSPYPDDRAWAVDALSLSCTLDEQRCVRVRGGAHLIYAKRTSLHPSAPPVLSRFWGAGRCAPPSTCWT